MAKSNCPAEDSAPPQASAGQLTPRFLPLSLSGRLLQVTVAISPSAAKGASKGNGFLRASDRKVPAVKCRILKGGREGSFDGEKEIYTKWKVLRTSGRGLAVRFGPASWASLVIEFCQLGGIYRLPEKFPSRCVFKRCICRGTFRLEQNQKTAKRLFRNIFQRGDMGG